MYGRAALARRRWYVRRPALRRQLARPVISVGALAAGGSGKTPLAGHVAALLAARGERPALLARGYARRRPADGVLVVRDWQAVRAGVDEAGDEPLMLARAQPQAAVLVAEDRYLAGRFAERVLDATVHVLDDGFQYLGLRRDIDLLLLAESDVQDPRTLPAGRLREPLAAARGADALLVEGAAPAARAVAERLGIPRVFECRRMIGPLRAAGSGAPAALPAGAPLVAVAGIARPERFFAALRRAGHALAATLAFRDHCPYGAREVARIRRLAAGHGGAHVVTTEKDLVRLLPHAPLAFELLWAPLEVALEPAAAFGGWLEERLQQVRT